jgi:hypothetical protein
MPKKTTQPGNGRINFRLTEVLQERLLRFTREEGHQDLSQACRYLLQMAMSERYGTPVTVYRHPNTPALKVADAPDDSAHLK